MFKKIVACLLFLFSATLFAKPLTIVAAENFYGDIAQKIGGPYVTVTNILNNPNQDPHLFSSTPSVAKAIATSDLVIYNGIDYDPWMVNLLAPIRQTKDIIVVANLVDKKSGDNPHIWYDPQTMLTLAETLAQKLSQIDPAQASYFQQQLKGFKQQYTSLTAKISALKQRYEGTPIIATEPVFNEMAKALGLQMRGTGFQLSVMNETEPSASDTRDFANQLTKRQVKVLIYNSQVSNPLTENMLQLAKTAGIPIVGITETQPSGQDYFNWMHNELNALAAALSEK